MTYLGIPISDRPLPRNCWDSLIRQVQDRLGRWQNQSLSRGGRLTLVNAVLSQIPTFLLSYHWCPEWVLRRLDGLRRSFFWRGREGHPGIVLAGWEGICCRREEGGLGVTDLRNFNLALLAKWL